jgi:hypothetical protein
LKPHNYGTPQSSQRKNGWRSTPIPPALHLHGLVMFNLVERWFCDPTDEPILCGVFHSVNELITAIEDSLRVNNDDPKPFIWTTTAE